jgi:hypothetical protein
MPHRGMHPTPPRPGRRTAMILIMPKLDGRVRERAVGFAAGRGREPLGARPESTVAEMSARRAAGRVALPAREPGSESAA